MTAVLIGYARCSTDKQDLEANRQILLDLGVPADQIYLDRASSGRAPKLSKTRQAHLLKLHAAANTPSPNWKLFEVSRPTVYRVLERASITTATADAA
ncbi:recombinase family protein [Actinoplanes siamensis]|uniref:Resolvase/invertase-type recombinase catalytic domain-containing protein n=1 Tax=Actinoplanes siamensis TaxID=1223317 RepID=A0A919TK80_9ACTN|nr:recombinase family protein [Actinoplanes siamensis]GIF05078.1 hypothetical protein Asi03nite_26160 [Actinoplanes siamensis]